MEEKINMILVNLTDKKLFVNNEHIVDQYDKTYKSTKDNLLKSVNDLSELMNEVLKINDEEKKKADEDGAEIMFVIKQDDYQMLKKYKKNIAPTNAFCEDLGLKIEEIDVKSLCEFRKIEEEDIDWLQIALEDNGNSEHILSREDKDSIQIVINEAENSGFSLDILDFAECEMAYGIFLGSKIIGFLSLGYADGNKVIENHESHNEDSRMLGNVYILDRFRKENLMPELIKIAINDLDPATSIYLNFIDDWLENYYSKLGFSKIADNTMFAKREDILNGK